MRQWPVGFESPKSSPLEVLSPRPSIVVIGGPVAVKATPLSRSAQAFAVGPGPSLDSHQPTAQRRPLPGGGEGAEVKSTVGNGFFWVDGKESQMSYRCNTLSHRGDGRGGAR